MKTIKVSGVTKYIKECDSIARVYCNSVSIWVIMLDNINPIWTTINVNTILKAYDMLFCIDVHTINSIET